MKILRMFTVTKTISKIYHLNITSHRSSKPPTHKDSHIQQLESVKTVPQIAGTSKGKPSVPKVPSQHKFSKKSSIKSSKSNKSKQDSKKGESQKSDFVEKRPSEPASKVSKFEAKKSEAVFDPEIYSNRSWLSK